jgi:hypothetical protein
LVEHGTPNSIFDEEEGFVAKAIEKDNSAVFDDLDTDGTAVDEGDF